MSAPAGIVSFKDETAAQQHYDRENDEFDVPVASWDWKKAVDCLLCVGPDGAGTRQEGFAHVIFLIVFTLVALAQTASWPNVSAFNEAIHDRFQLQTDLRSTTELWDWLETPFLDTILPAAAAAPGHLVNGSLVLLGQVQLRQLLVNEGACTTPPALQG
eukprot:1463853-Rhodomonas_salina.1